MVSKYLSLLFTRIFKGTGRSMITSCQQLCLNHGHKLTGVLQILVGVCFDSVLSPQHLRIQRPHLQGWVSSCSSCLERQVAFQPHPCRASGALSSSLPETLPHNGRTPASFEDLVPWRHFGLRCLTSAIRKCPADLFAS